MAREFLDKEYRSAFKAVDKAIKALNDVDEETAIRGNAERSLISAQLEELIMKLKMNLNKKL